MLADGVRKKVANFQQHASDLHTSLDAVTAAYDAANAAAIAAGMNGHKPCLITSKIGPTVDRRGCYQVTTTPCGYEPHISNEQVGTATPS